MQAKLSGAVGGGLTELAGKNGVPFFIQGTTSDPKFVPDVKGMPGNSLWTAGKSPASIVNGLGGCLGRRKNSSWKSVGFFDFTGRFAKRIGLLRSV
jgi:hypothetical protein